MRRPLPHLMVVALVAGCVADLGGTGTEARADEAYFRCRVQPVLTKSCSALLCHGDPQRYFRVYARNRLRLGGTEATRNAFLRDEERAFNFASARAFLDARDPGTSFLLMKPLDQVAGGYYHGGATKFGKGDVFTSPSDADYKTLVAWASGQTEDPTCVEPGSDL